MIDRPFKTIAQEYAQAADKRAKERAEQLEAKAYEIINSACAGRNDGVEPTIDRCGNLHAPHDGYMHDDRAYKAGEFLPIPDDVREQIYLETGKMQEVKSFDKTVRTEIDVADFEEIKEALKNYADCSKGKAWENGSCFVYIRTRKKSLLDLVNRYNKALIEERKLFKGTAPAGPAEVTGEVYKIQYNRHWDRFTVMLGLKNGATVHGTLPAKIKDANRGDVVSFKATFTHNKGDHTHAFFRRPTKAKFISRKEQVTA